MWGKKLPIEPTPTVSARATKTVGDSPKVPTPIGISPDYPPLAYKDAPFGLVGVEVDLAKQLGQGLGKEIVLWRRHFRS